MMRKLSGLLLFGSLIPVTLVLGAGTGVAAQESHGGGFRPDWFLDGICDASDRPVRRH